MLVAIAIYGGWAAATWFHDKLPWWALFLIGGWLVAWHGSLQHETIHGHPTSSRRINAAIGWAPLGLWMPYPIYRALHLVHHRNSRLTLPGVDPESFYVTPEAWERMSSPLRWLTLANQTLLGRLVLGPVFAVAQFWRGEAASLLRGDRWRRRIWLAHVAASAAILLWATVVAGMPLWLYLACFAYPGLALTLMRSFAEHRAPRDEGQGASAVVTAGPVMSLLYLNNNLHVAHHTRPAAPWYDLPAVNREIDGADTAARGAGLFRSYGELMARYLLRRVDHPVHPGRPQPAE